MFRGHFGVAHAALSMKVHGLLGPLETEAKAKEEGLRFAWDQGVVEVGRVWLELPSPIYSSKPNTSSIRKSNSTRIIIPSTSPPIYIYIYILGL